VLETALEPARQAFWQPWRRYWRAVLSVFVAQYRMAQQKRQQE
jgi:hypothetical protein